MEKSAMLLLPETAGISAPEGFGKSLRFRNLEDRGYTCGTEIVSKAPGSLKVKRYPHFRYVSIPRHL